MTIREMASAARGYITGIDWDATGLSAEDAVYDIGYLDQIVDVWQKAEAIRDQLALSYDLDPAQSGAAWSVAQQGLLSVEGAFVHALNANQPWLSDDLQLDTEVWRAFVSKLYIDAMQAAVIHRNLILQLGAVTPSEIVSSADAVFAAFSCFNLLWELGVLDPLKRSNPTPAPVSGLGDLSVAAMVTIGAVLAVGVIAAAYIMTQQNEVTASLADDICNAAINETDPERQARLLEACGTARENIINNLSRKPGEEALNIAMTILAVGAVAYGAFLLMPHFARALRKTRRQEA